MKIKSILLPVFITLASILLSSSVFAQNNIAYAIQTLKEDLRDAFTQAKEDIQKESQPSLLEKISGDLPINLEELSEDIKGELTKNKITKPEQYLLMKNCVIKHRNDVLQVLIEAGFDINADMNITSLPALAVIYNNADAFGLTFDYTEERERHVFEELDGDQSFIERFTHFLEIYNPDNSLRFVQQPDGMMRTDAH